MAKTTERHKRETAAIAGAVNDVSREAVRQASVLSLYAPEVAQEVRAGSKSLWREYRALRGDPRVGLFVMVMPEVRDLIRAAAERYKLTMADIVTFAVTQIFGESSEAG